MTKGKSKSAVYYQNNKSARDKKKKYDTEFGKKKEQRRKRSQLVKERRKRGIYGSGGKDLAHTSNGLRLQSPSKNRGSKSAQPGDRRARGGKKKK